MASSSSSSSQSSLSSSSSSQSSVSSSSSSSMSSRSSSSSSSTSPRIRELERLRDELITRFYKRVTRHVPSSTEPPVDTSEITRYLNDLPSMLTPIEHCQNPNLDVT